MKNLTIIALVAALACPAFAASPDAQPAPAAKDSKELPACCKAKMAEKEKLTKDMAAMDAKVDELVATLKGASADKKVAALRRVVELVTQRKSLTEMVAKCQTGMGHAGCTMEHKETAEAGKAGCSHMKAAKS